MEVSAPVELEPGFFELRINWSASDLMAMSPHDFAEFKELIDVFQQFVAQLPGSEQ